MSELKRFRARVWGGANVGGGIWAGLYDTYHTEPVATCYTDNRGVWMMMAAGPGPHYVLFGLKPGEPIMNAGGLVLPITDAET